MGKIHMRNEVPLQPSRCDSCQHAHVIVGYRESEAMVFCNFVYEQLIPVQFKVRECSNYSDKNRPTWEQMKDLALPIKEATTARATGFRLPFPADLDQKAAATNK